MYVLYFFRYSLVQPSNIAMAAKGLSRLEIYLCGLKQSVSRQPIRRTVKLKQWRSSKITQCGLPQIWCRLCTTNRNSKLRLCGICLGFAPFSFLKSKQKNVQPQVHDIHTLSLEALATIPKEVFHKDKPIKKRKRNIINQFFFTIWEGTLLLLRFIRISFTFGPIFVIYPFTRYNDRLRERWLRLLLSALEITGPTFIKLGQWASTRRDLFSDDLCDLFVKLYAHTRKHSWFMTRRRLTKAFGKRWKDLFVKFEKKPIGSGSIAQVY